MKGVVPPLPERFPKKDEVYMHYKGDTYKVHSLALHSNDDIWMVIYEPMYSDADAELFTRPLSEWDEDVGWQGGVVKRFTLLPR